MSAAELIADAQRRQTQQLRADVVAAQAEARRAWEHATRLEKALVDLKAEKFRPLVVTPAPRAKATKHGIRVVIPDSHGAHIDPVARDAFLRDMDVVGADVSQVVWLGDHLDAGGTFSAHQRSYTNEMTESYADDLRMAREFIVATRHRTRNAEHHYLAGNHEAHVERWAARNMHVRDDADLLIKVFGPAALLNLKALDIRYYESKEFYGGCSIRGTIKLGKCFFTHGISHSKHAASTHLERFNSNIQFGHIHRAQEVRSRSVSSQGYLAACPGTLAKLQPLYKHTEPTTWTHGYGLDFYSAGTGRFAHFQIPIFSDGTTGLAPMLGAVQRLRKVSR